ncbi:redoxin domain-containing protein [Bacillus sp. P14.5]|uniref:peroxiredoxin family protein n=1 Tax=Bacillus sp. P14.5 TaxID=1983400 RepID=UPI000DEA3D2A|nr:redoxin domain-containing protein [Bacillus sp. P14.5]
MFRLSNENLLQEEFIKVPAKNFELSDTNGKFHNLKDLVKNGLILVFVDAQCTHCENNLEEFIYEVGFKFKKNFVVICGDSDLKQCEKLSRLYDHKFLVLQGDKEVFAEYEIPFLPAFYYINNQQIITKKTPIPYQLIHMPA